MRIGLAAAAAALAATGCATSSVATDPNDAYDPYEGFNRVSNTVNNGVDRVLLEPIAKGYRAVTPEPARDGVRNALANLNSPVVLVNDVLQGEPDRATDTFFRFMINSTIGVAGLWDAAAHFGLEGHTEDFGQTLAVWGVPEGPYYVIPLLGPGNTRDGVGRVADIFFNPLTWVEFENANLDGIIQGGATGLTIISAREQFIEQFDALRSQPDPYIALRRAYTSSRRAAVRNGVQEDDPFEGLPDLEEFDDFEDDAEFETPASAGPGGG